MLYWCQICNRMTDEFCEEKCDLFAYYSKEQDDDLEEVEDDPTKET